MCNEKSYANSFFTHILVEANVQIQNVNKNKKKINK